MTATMTETSPSSASGSEASFAFVSTDSGGMSETHPDPAPAIENLSVADSRKAKGTTTTTTFAGLDGVRSASERVEEALNLRDLEYRKLADSLNAVEKRLEERFGALEEKRASSAKASGHPNPSEDDRIEINAGGRIFVAKRGALCQIKGTRMEALFGGRHDKQLQKDRSGRIFLDINPKCFRAIVDYLNDLRTFKDDPPDLPSVSDEYYHVLASQVELFGLGEAFVKPLESTIITNNDQSRLLHQALAEDCSDGDFQLLYRSSRDGISGKHFHSKCDNKGCTISIIQTESDRIVGGYSNTNWESGDDIPPSGAFAHAPSTAIVPSPPKSGGSAPGSAEKLGASAPAPFASKVGGFAPASSAPKSGGFSFGGAPPSGPFEQSLPKNPFFTSFGSVPSKQPFGASTNKIPFGKGNPFTSKNDQRSDTSDSAKDSNLPSKQPFASTNQRPFGKGNAFTPKNNQRSNTSDSAKGSNFLFAGDGNINSIGATGFRFGKSSPNKTSSGNYKIADKAFLFAFDTEGTANFSKMKVKASHKKSAVYNDSKHGPTFGKYSNDAGHDLCVKDASLHLSFGGTYEVAKCLKRYEACTIKELEVFQIVQKPGQSTFTPRTDVRSQYDSKEPISICEASSFSSGVNHALNLKLKALVRAEKEISRLESIFEDEENFINSFAGGKVQDIVTLNVSGTLVATNRSTLQVFGESVLARCETEQDSEMKQVEEWKPSDVADWVEKIDGIPVEVGRILSREEITGRELLSLGVEGLNALGIVRVGTVYLLLDEIGKPKRSGHDVAQLIEHSPYCFGKILDYLRLKRLHTQKIVDAPMLPSIRESERKRFKNIVQHYFPGAGAESLLE